MTKALFILIVAIGLGIVIELFHGTRAKADVPQGIFVERTLRVGQEVNFQRVRDRETGHLCYIASAGQGTLNGHYASIITVTMSCFPEK